MLFDFQFSVEIYMFVKIILNVIVSKNKTVIKIVGFGKFSRWPKIHFRCEFSQIKNKISDLDQD